MTVAGYGENLVVDACLFLVSRAMLWSIAHAAAEVVISCQDVLR